MKVIPDGYFTYDGLKDGVALEVELSLVDSTFKDYFKFMMGKRLGRVDVGLLVVSKRKKNVAFFGFGLRNSLSASHSIPSQ